VRILLDESLPRPLGSALTGHEVSTVQAESWTSLSNGVLLRHAAEKFDVLLTADRNIEFQQNLATAARASWRNRVTRPASALSSGFRTLSATIRRWRATALAVAASTRPTSRTRYFERRQ
jgi:hypothetical protein